MLAVLQENVFYDVPPRKPTWFYLKLKSEKQSLLRVRLVWKAEFQIMILWKICLLETSTEITPVWVDGAQHKPGILLPGFCLFIPSISAVQLGKNTVTDVCVLWSSRWVGMRSCFLCRHLSGGDSESCWAAPALPGGRGHCQGSWGSAWSHASIQISVPMSGCDAPVCLWCASCLRQHRPC